MNIKRKEVLIFFVIVLICLNSVIVFANERNDGIGTGKNTIFVDNGEEIDDGIPNVTMDEVSDWVDRKGFEIVGLLQRFVQPFAIIIFIGCAILALIGAFGNGKLVSSGILGMVIALVLYSVVVFAPELMDTFLNWVRS